MINGISNTFLNTITDAGSAQAKADEVKFKEILEKTKNGAEAEDEQLQEACEAFEAYYLNKVFGQMRKTIPKSDLVDKSQGRDYFEDMLYDAYSKEIAGGNGAGLKEMLYKQLKNTNG